MEAMRFTINKIIVLVAFLQINLLIPTSFLSQTYNFRFDHLSIADGLPDDGLTCIAQDSLGFIWIGTRNGLVKYDGYDFVVYKNIGNDSTSILGNSILQIFADKYNDIWIGTNKGLSVFKRNKDKFLNFPKKKIIEKYETSNFVKSIFEDKQGNIWLGKSGGVHEFVSSEYVKHKDSAMVFKNIPLDYSYVSLNYLNDIVEDKDGIVWGATGAGLVNLSSNEFEIYQTSPSKKQNWNNYFNSIVVDKNNSLWIATVANGLANFNKNSPKFKFYKCSNLENSTYFFNHIKCICINEEDIIFTGPWLCGRGYGGLMLFDIKKKEFSKFYKDPYNPFSLSSDRNGLTDIIQDCFGNYWITFEEDKLNLISEKYNSFTYYRNYSLNKEDINFTRHTLSFIAKDNKIYFVSRYGLFQYFSNKNSFLKLKPLNPPKEDFFGRIVQDYKGNIWTGSTEIRVYNPVTKVWKYLNKNLITNGYTAYCLLADSDSLIWIGTWGGGGLVKYDPRNNSIERYLHDSHNKNTISSNTIIEICEDSLDNIWISTSDGLLNKINKKNGEIKRFEIDDIGYIDGLFTDSKNSVWAGTLKKGLLIINPETDTIRNITKSDGLPSDIYITGFSEDDLGNIYCCSPNYLIRFNDKAEIDSYYKISMNDEFLHYTMFDWKTRELYIISDKGFYKIHVDNLNKNSTPPKMVLTDIKISDKSLSVEDDSPLKSHINLAKSIILEHWQNDISIEYSALYFFNQSENKYKYYLENYDQEWKKVDHNREAVYTNLSHGDYTFKVLGSNSDGVWAKEPATLSITILPPFWLTWWAYSIYTFLIISTLTYLYYLQKRRLRLKHEMEMKEFEAMKLKEVDQMKSKFFANISHEFRTPLTLIKGPIERLIGDEKVDDPKKIYRMIKRNSERLLNLINELLDLSKLESGNMKLSAQYSDIVSFTKGVAMSFESLAIKKEIHISINSDREVIELYFDKEKLQKILSNIISNSFKFTSQGGKIELNISEDLTEKKVIIKISDNGIGIPEEELPKIFDRFYQVNSSKSDMAQGTGIGLALTKELVEMHKGTISVNSVLGKGTSFILSFLLGNEHLKKDEIIYEDVYESSKELYLEDEQNETSKKEKTLVLVVEDNIDVQNFIKDAVEKKYRFIKADDGIEGFNKAQQFMPDLIVSDIMMPRESGDRMCERLKKDQITSHIPIILLTAKASQEDKIIGLEIGADDYLIKPFNETELLVRIGNLIKQRHKLREKYLREAEIHPTEVAVTSLDKKFIEKIIKLTDENISQPEFNIELFADKLAMSRVQLYRKFTSILGEKPTEFVRNYRIKRSAELMKQNFGNIAQIAYEVGFNNLSYFAKSFKKIYKVSPHEYCKNLQTNKSS